MVRWPRCAIALDRRRYQPPGNHALGLRVRSRPGRGVSLLPETSRFPWSNGVHLLGSRRDREAPERLGRHLLGQKLGQESSSGGQSQGRIPRSRLWPNRLLGRPQRAFRELGNLECTPRSVRPMAQQQVVGPSEVRVLERPPSPSTPSPPNSAQPAGARRS